jgi:hypothetical protein
LFVCYPSLATLQNERPNFFGKFGGCIQRNSSAQGITYQTDPIQLEVLQKHLQTLDNSIKVKRLGKRELGIMAVPGQVGHEAKEMVDAKLGYGEPIRTRAHKPMQEHNGEVVSLSP